MVLTRHPIGEKGLCARAVSVGDIMLKRNERSPPGIDTGLKVAGRHWALSELNHSVSTDTLDTTRPRMLGRSVRVTPLGVECVKCRDT